MFFVSKFHITSELPDLDLPQTPDGVVITDAISLEKWMEEKIDDIPIALETINPTEYLRQYEGVSSTVFRELCRQVSIQESDRGRLLVSVWNKTAEVTQKVFEVIVTSLQENMQVYKDQVSTYVRKRFFFPIFAVKSILLSARS